MTTTTQRQVLRKARAAIRRHPESYDQAVWGAPGKPSCETPACVAGHIVSETDSGRSAYEVALSDPEVRAESNPERRHQLAVVRAATEALALSRSPKLFEPVWPRKWLDSLGYENQDADYPMGDIIEPSAEEAIAIINGIIDGQLTDALKESTRSTPSGA